jgi:hypothetical protein
VIVNKARVSNRSTTPVRLAAPATFLLATIELVAAWHCLPGMMRVAMSDVAIVRIVTADAANRLPAATKDSFDNHASCVGT